jgi:hypothetical protein
MKQQFHGKHFAFTIALGLSACATTGPAPSTATPASVSPPATAATSAQSGPNAYGNYLRVVRGGQTLYCQKDTETSSRMVHETCLTPAQAQAQQDSARQFMQGAQGIATTPISPQNVH